MRGDNPPVYNETEASDLGFFCLLKAYFIVHFVKKDNFPMMSGLPTGCNMPILLYTPKRDKL